MISWRWLGDRLDDERVHVEAEPRAEHGGAQHAHGIFDEPHVRIADRSNHALLEIAPGRRRSR